MVDHRPAELEKLVLRLQGGDPSALESLISATQDMGWQTAYGLLQNREETEDALQDAYLLAYQKIGQLQEPRAFAGWFKRILVHRCLRLKQRQSPLELDHDPAEHEPAPEVEATLDLRTAFRKLADGDRTVLGLREVLDLSYDEISALLEVPLSTVKTRLYHARQRLQRFLQRGASR